MHIAPSIPLFFSCGSVLECSPSRSSSLKQKGCAVLAYERSWFSSGFRCDNQRHGSLYGLRSGMEQRRRRDEWVLARNKSKLPAQRTEKKRERDPPGAGKAGDCAFQARSLAPLHARVRTLVSRLQAQLARQWNYVCVLLFHDFSFFFLTVISRRVSASLKSFVSKKRN